LGDRVIDACAAIHCAGLVVDLVRPPPANLPYKPSSDPTVGSAMPPCYDAIVSLSEPEEVVRDWEDLIGVQVAAAHIYVVEERVVFDKNRSRAIGRTPGMKLFGQLQFHSDLPDSAARRSWSLHAKLAERVHVGASRYVQNWVVGQISRGAPKASGFPEMYFPTKADLIDRFFDSPRGAMEIYHDTAHFVASGPRFYATEHVLRLS